MSKNLKIINATKEFFEQEVGNNTWSAQKLSLSKNYPVSIILEAKIGGADGGSCYGTSASEFRVPDDEIKSELASSLNYKIKGFLESLGITSDTLQKKSDLMADNIYECEIGESSDGSDYYGNHSIYRAYEVNVVSFLKDLVPDDVYQVIQGVASTIKRERDFNYESLQLETKEQNIVNQLDLFDP